MPTTLLAQNLARAAKLVAPHIGKGPIKLLENALLTARDGILYVVATNLDHAAIARVGARIGADWRDITVPPKLLAEWLEAVTSATRPTPPLKDSFKSQRGDELVYLEADSPAALKLTCGRTTAHIYGCRPDEFPVVKFPEVWPTDSDGNALEVALVGGVEAEVSKADWLFWVPTRDDHTQAWVRLPHIGKRLTFPDIPGHFFITGKDKFELYDSLSGQIFTGKDTLTNRHKELSEHLDDLEQGRALGVVACPVPESLPFSEAPKWGKKLEKAVGKIWCGESGIDYLTVFSDQAPADMLAYLTAALTARAEAREAHQARLKAELDKQQAEEAERKRLAELEAAAEQERRSAFDLRCGIEIGVGLAPESYKEEARLKWSGKHAQELQLARTFWVQSKTVSDRDLKYEFYKPTLGQSKLVSRMWNALDQAYRPDYHAERRRQFEAVMEESSARQDVAIEAAEAEDGAEAPEDTPAPVALREFPPEVTAQIAVLAPYTSAVEFRGPWPWATPLDGSAKQVLLAAGFRVEIKTGRLYGAPDKTRRLPVVLCHRLPAVTYSPYVR